MSQPTPPTYQQSEAMSNPHYSGPDPIYPNMRQEQYEKNRFPQHNYPPTPAEQSNPEPPYPTDNPRPVHVMGYRNPGTSVHVVGAAIPVSVVTPHFMGPNPSTVTCPSCKETVTSSVRTESGMLAWLIAGGLCIFGCWCGCCLIPFCLDSCKDVYHTCPRCNTFLGKFSRLR